MTNILALYEESADELLSTITRIAASKRRPPTEAADVVESLKRAGAIELLRHLGRAATKLRAAVRSS